MLRKVLFTKTAKIIVILAIITAVIGFAERTGNDGTCSDIVIKIENQQNNYFVDENDILTLMTDEGNAVIIGSHFDDLNLKEIESRVAKESFIKDVQIYKDLKGNMLVHAELRRPFVRVIGQKTNKYIALDGTYLPTSRKYNTRAMIVTGKYFAQDTSANITDTAEGEALFQMLQFIYNDKFWNAQVAQLDIDKDLDITLHPQVTKQLVEFGTPEGFEKKFKKLKIFYQDILPRKGWNRYERVNLKYGDQIIAE